MWLVNEVPLEGASEGNHALMPSINAATKPLVSEIPRGWKTKGGLSNL